MHTPETSSLFTGWKNPSNGVESLILTERVAPVQQSFYYTHPSFSRDGRFLWFGCGFPPSGGRHAQQLLGVADLERGETRVYHETQYPLTRPWIDLDTGEAYWGNQLDFWKRGPLPFDSPVRVNSLPAEFVQDLRVTCLSTHPTFSADRHSLNIDLRALKADGTPVSIIGDLPVDGGAFRLWQRTEGYSYDHGLLSPVDPDLQLFSHEFWQDGERLGIPFDGAKPYHRIWLIRRGEKAAPLLREPVSHSGHEWWDASGSFVWYLHYGVGVKKVSLATREETLVWPGNLSHAHASRDSRYLVADHMTDPANPECRVLFRDTVSGHEIEIVNRAPLGPRFTQCTHLHPHPQFCLDDRYICYTTTVYDRVDVALVRVADLIEKTR